MKRVLILSAVLLMAPALNLWAEPRMGGAEGGGNPVFAGHDGGSPQSAPAASAPAPSAPAASAPAPSNGPQSNRAYISHTVSAPAVHAPVVINMNHGSSGGHNRNFPSQQPSYSAPANNNSNQQAAQRQPSYGHVQWNNTMNNNVRSQRGKKPVTNPMVGQPFQRPQVQSFNRAGVRAAVAVHHHPYTQGYVRKKLQKLGVTSEPAVITERAEMIHTDRAHSVIRYPQTGFDHGRINATLVSPRHFNDDVVRNQFTMVDSPEWRSRLNEGMARENRPGHYYWHNEGSFNYCHYMDDSGYHWYGWYVGNQYFWTRYFGQRWWTYDADYDRWCFWNNGFWWWQDPYHVGDLYCYNNATYIPCNSSDDQIVVTAPTDTSLQTTTSPDGTRMVKIDTETQDAFLYDTSAQPAFDPVYLASGVQSVQFSDTSNGRPLEIMLKLNDGSFDMFDDMGNAYNSGVDEPVSDAGTNGPVVNNVQLAPGQPIPATNNPVFAQ